MWQHMFSMSVMLTVWRRELDFCPAHVIRTHSSKMNNADTGILHNTVIHVPQNHTTMVQQMDLDTSETQFHDLSISKQCKVLRLRGTDNILSDAADLMLSIYRVQFLMNLVKTFVETGACLCAALK